MLAGFEVVNDSVLRKNPSESFRQPTTTHTVTLRSYVLNVKSVEVGLQFLCVVCPPKPRNT